MIDNKRKRNIDISGKTLTMEKSLNLNLVVCESENEIGRSISNMTLNVLCEYLENVTIKVVKSLLFELIKRDFKPKIFLIFAFKSTIFNRKFLFLNLKIGFENPTYKYN